MYTHKIVNNVKIPLTAAEIAELEARDALPKTAEELNAPILAKIASLEASQARNVREAVLSGDKTRLLALEDQIKTLRAKLK